MLITWWREQWVYAALVPTLDPVDAQRADDLVQRQDDAPMTLTWPETI